MKKIIFLNKKEGETPLEALESFRQKNKEYKDVKMTYAGRLDPMASGLLLLLAGEKTKEKEKYFKLGKEYEFEILFGFATDTYDILGKIVGKDLKNKITKKELEKLINFRLKDFLGNFMQKYPLYSSKTVDGEPLFIYARSGETVDIPEREVYVQNLEFLKTKNISGKNLLKSIEKRIKKVHGDFRQNEILQIWQKYLTKNDAGFFVASLKIKCGSGVYVRSIANNLGEKIGIPALAFSIKRTKIGNKKLSNIKN